MSDALQRLARRLRGRSPAELRDRAGQAVAKVAERLGRGGERSDRAFQRRLAEGGAGRDLDALARALKAGLRPPFFPGMDDPAATARLVAGRFAPRVDEIVRSATAILEGRFQLLGFGTQVYGNPPQWHRDVQLGVTAPRGHWSTIAYLDPRVAGDHKLVWEVNRHQFLVTLGQAWQLTGEMRFARGAAALLTSWLDTNPPGRGVNWASSLEVAYRAIAWAWAHRLLRDAGPFDHALQLRWLKALDASAHHVSRFLSTWFSPNTHLTGEALGLLYVGTQFPELRHAARWATQGWDILVSQLPRQVRPDGTYFEQATYYHRYTLDIYLHAYVLGYGRPAAQLQRMAQGIAGLAEFLAWIARADGTIPLFGDEDGGRLLFLDGRAVDDVRSSLAVSAVLLGNGVLKGAAGPSTDEVAWMLGEAGLRTFGALPAASPLACSRAFDEGGFYTMRDGWTGDGAVLTVDCGPLGMANGGHAHADTLAFDLAIGGRHVFVDAGTVSYTTDPAERDAMRRSHAHNTVTLDDVSSSEPAGAFQWAQMTAGVRDAWIALPSGAYFEGHHDGYARLASAARHRRSVLAAREGWWLVRDLVESAGPHEAVATFQCAAGLDVAAAGDSIRVTDDGLPVVSVTAVGGDGAWQVDTGIASRRYGARDAAPRARYAFRTRETTAVIFAVVRAGSDACDVTSPAVGAGQAVAIRTPRYHDLVLFGVDEVVERVRTDARVAWVRRRSSDGVAESLMMVGGSMIEVDGVSVAVTPGGIVSATRGPGGWQVARLGEESRPPDRPRP